MAEMGRRNRLKVVKEVDFGLYLDGGEFGEVLLPARYVPKGCAVGDILDVFVYRDSEDRPIATTEKPYGLVGEFACLKVVAVNRTGAFLDWGLLKDLLVPFDEQKPRMEVGKYYVVRLYIDEPSNRIVASARLDDFLERVDDGDFEEGQQVELFIANRSELGYQVIINNSHWGLLHHQEVATPLRRGEKVTGFIRRIREDGLLDACLHLQASYKTGDAAQIILDRLRQRGGFITATDNSAPADIEALFGISKNMFKKAIGALYKQRKIVIESEGIRLITPWDAARK